MAKKKNQKTPFASDKGGDLFVEVSAVMTPILAMIDGLPIVFFGRQKTAYLKIETAIEWCQKELGFSGDKKYQQMIDLMEKVKSQESQSP